MSTERRQLLETPYVVLRHELGEGAYVDVVPEFLDTVAAEQLLGKLKTELRWHQGSVRIFGRDIPEPRLTAWFGDEPYTYSGRTLPVTPWPPRLATLRDAVNGASGASFNTLLLNRYRDGRDSMGFHSDDERELGLNPCVACLSLGSPRRFVLRPKRAGAGVSLELSLRHGSLLVMGGSCQHTHRHAIPKQPGEPAERISLTFRRVLRA